ncbi:hypothetical protein JD844_032809 [Phrynosoma platyrhinos]|uniref:RRM domain-containing protein n=1 Tax=Phrynosoma platyrhinos TaxID=52577 RepID=A0ABQ7T6L9_PHRPL|nr:hypothetical protein JD844_032809 [Phrynosoma platyrhinos]
MAASERAEGPDRTLFVGNLESRVQEEILYELFLQVPGTAGRGGAGAEWAGLGSNGRGEEAEVNNSQPEAAGPITKVTICKDKDGKPKAFGFVCFKHRESVPYAIALLNGIRLYGRPIKLQYRFGSSHSLDLNSPWKNMENDVQSPTYRTGEPYGGSPMTHILQQQYAPFSPIGQQLPYYQMVTPPPPPISPYLNPGQTSFDFVYSEIKNHRKNLVKAGTYKRKRNQESSDSDSSMENERKKTRRK